MICFANSAQDLRDVKTAARAHLPHIPSSHLSEAVAAAAGEQSHAALLARIENGIALEYIPLDDRRFVARLSELGHAAGRDWKGFTPILSARWIGSRYTSARSLAWRNMMVAALNSGLELKLFSLDPAGNFWPGVDKAYGYGVPGCSYPVTVPGGIPAQAYVSDAGFGELAIHVAYWPTKGDALVTADAGFAAGDAFASGWFERQNGKWLHSIRGGKLAHLTLSVRSTRLPHVSAAVIRARGFEDQGRWIF